MDKYLIALLLLITGCDAPELAIADSSTERPQIVATGDASSDTDTTEDASAPVRDGAVSETDATFMEPTCNGCFRNGRCIEETTPAACGRNDVCTVCAEPVEVECHLAACRADGTCGIDTRPDGSRCASGSGVCYGGRCEPCGGLLNACCTSSVCGAGLVCRGSDNVCVRCGTRYYPACAGNTCTDGTEFDPSTGRCTCGGTNQVCCPNVLGGAPLCASGMPCGTTGRCA